MATSCPRLRVLWVSMVFCQCNDEGGVALAAGCPDLEELSILSADLGDMGGHLGNVTGW